MRTGRFHSSNVFAEPTPHLVKQFGGGGQVNGGTSQAAAIETEDGASVILTEDGNVLKNEN